MNASVPWRAVHPWKRRECIWVPALCVIVAIGCDGARFYRAALRDKIAALQEIEEILASVHDQPSMQAAKLRLEGDLALQCEEIRQRFLELGEPSEEVKAKLAVEAVQLQQAVNRVQVEIGSIQKLPGGPDFLKHLNAGPGF